MLPRQRATGGRRGGSSYGNNDNQPRKLIRKVDEITAKNLSKYGNKNNLMRLHSNEEKPSTRSQNRLRSLNTKSQRKNSRENGGKQNSRGNVGGKKKTRRSVSQKKNRNASQSRGKARRKSQDALKKLESRKIEIEQEGHESRPAPPQKSRDPGIGPGKNMKLRPRTFQVKPQARLVAEQQQPPIEPEISESEKVQRVMTGLTTRMDSEMRGFANQLQTRNDHQEMFKEHESLISGILLEEEELLETHKKYLDRNIKEFEEESTLLNEVDAPGSDIDKYIGSLKHLLDTKLMRVVQLKMSLCNFENNLKREKLLNERIHEIMKDQDENVEEPVDTNKGMGWNNYSQQEEQTPSSRIQEEAPYRLVEESPSSKKYEPQQERNYNHQNHGNPYASEGFAENPQPFRPPNMSHNQYEGAPGQYNQHPESHHYEMQPHSNQHGHQRGHGMRNGEQNNHQNGRFDMGPAYQGMDQRGNSGYPERNPGQGAWGKAKPNNLQPMGKYDDYRHPNY